MAIAYPAAQPAITASTAYGLHRFTGLHSDGLVRVSMTVQGRPAARAATEGASAGGPIQKSVGPAPARRMGSAIRVSRSSHRAASPGNMSKATRSNEL